MYVFSYVRLVPLHLHVGPNEAADLGYNGRDDGLPAQRKPIMTQQLFRQGVPQLGMRLSEGEINNYTLMEGRKEIRKEGR